MTEDPIPILTRLVALFLRFGEFVAASVVLGLSAYHLTPSTHRADYPAPSRSAPSRAPAGPLARAAYTLLVSCASLPLALARLVPGLAGRVHWAADAGLACAWLVGFGVAADALVRGGCGGAFEWGGLVGGFGGGGGSLEEEGAWRGCGRWRAVEAFGFVAAMLWFGSVGLVFL